MPRISLLWGRLPLVVQLGRLWLAAHWPGVVAAGAVLLLFGLGFVAGRLSQSPRPSTPPAAVAPARPGNLSTRSESPEVAQKPPESAGNHSSETSEAEEVPVPPAYLAWPARGRVVAEPGWQRHPVLGDWRYHGGLDLAAPPGAAVYAVLPGRVVAAGPFPPLPGEPAGLQIELDHGRGWRSRYLISGRAAVEIGAAVKQGEVIGYIGGPVDPGQAALHYTLLWRERTVDPRPWLR
ncbi:MAG: M23 family metallopeptidase [Bacillota bacterium]|nr:M23 family metallopeptidase [Bacillota bacterium]